MHNNKPNFLIVGAAKSGTTSLAKYLSAHKDIYIPEIKEPRFFVRDTILSVSDEDPLKEHLLKTSVLSETDYFKLYNVDKKLKGDASVHYLNDHNEAIPKIKNYLGDVPIIIMIRNPIDRLVSNYNYLNSKNLSSIEDEIDKEDFKKSNNYNSFWHFKDQGLYFNRIAAYNKNFTKVKIIIFEDFVSDTEKIYLETIKWLGLAEDVLPDFKVENQSTTPNLLYRFLISVGLIKFLKTFIINRLEFKIKIMKELKKKLFLKKAETFMPDDLRKDLIKYYEKDVKKLKDSYNLNLKSWSRDFYKIC